MHAMMIVFLIFSVTSFKKNTLLSQPLQLYNKKGNLYPIDRIADQVFQIIEKSPWVFLPPYIKNKKIPLIYSHIIHKDILYGLYISKDTTSLEIVMSITCTVESYQLKHLIPALEICAQLFPEDLQTINYLTDNLISEIAYYLETSYQYYDDPYYFPYPSEQSNRTFYTTIFRDPENTLNNFSRKVTINLKKHYNNITDI